MADNEFTREDNINLEAVDELKDINDQNASDETLSDMDKKGKSKKSDKKIFKKAAISDADKTSDKKGKKMRKKIIGSLIASVIIVALMVVIGAYIDKIDSYDIYTKPFATNWQEECEILQARYSIMILDNRDYLINALQNTNLKYGIVESKSDNLTDEELSMLSRYKVHNFDENFNISRCNVFFAELNDDTEISYDMSSIFGYAHLYNNRTDSYYDYYDYDAFADEDSDEYVVVETEDGEIAVEKVGADETYSEDANPDGTIEGDSENAQLSDNNDKKYVYVVSYVTEPTQTGRGLYGVDNGYGTITNPDLFIQLWVWLQLGYSLRYVVIVAEVILSIAFLGICLYWMINIVKLLTKAVKAMSYVPRTIVFLIAVSVISFFVFLFSSAFFDIGEELAILSWLLFNVFIVWPISIYYSYNAKLITDACEKLASGDMDVHVNSTGMIGDFKKQAASINTIRDSINLAVEERMKSERLKTELITNVSHDIKTPLTSIINYVDLLGRQEFDNPEAREYIEVLSRQSARLKKLIIDLIEASKAATGNVELEMMPCDARLILEQVIGEYEEKLSEQNLSLIVHMPEESATIMADSKSLFRIFDNLLVNIQKYSMPGTRAYVDLEHRDDKAIFVFRNMSREPLVEDGSLFMERFYQGDISRNAEGNGLGLAVSKSLTELMGGSIEVITDGDLFKVVISFDSP